MGLLQEILDYNQEFVATKQYEAFLTSKYPSKRAAIVACMDARLIELLLQAMNMKNGDANLVKVVGGDVSQAYEGVIRSLIISIYEFHVEEIFIVGHHHCGAQHLTPEQVFNEIEAEGININRNNQQLIDYFTGFGDLEESVRKNVALVKSHPLIPERIKVHGLLIDPETGKLDLVQTANQVERKEKELLMV
ncbi:beta-class carbonic anhydrase [Bacillus rubiinfantis]|uniref:beta-class carbonic anhydrase n=1 Tax=Bacillus rubiinfantis TaxID=1499680 RepID=UPI0005A68754|nr:carbonic anhydrase [Bacillus rubiinfantis]